MSNEFPTCPFCGGTAYLTHGGGVYCDNPQCGASTVSPAAWNRRVVSPAVKALVEAAKNALKQHDDPCSYDHHGSCQSHGQGGDDVCPVAHLRAALKKVEEEGR